MSAEQEGRRADREEIRAVRAEGQADRWEVRYRRNWYWWVIALVYVVGAPSGVVVFSGYQQRQSEQAWCEIITTLDDAYAVTPPTTPVGVQLAAAMARIRDEYGC